MEKNYHLTKIFCKKLANAFKQHDYDLTEDRMAYIVSCLNISCDIESSSEKTIIDFFNKVESGHFGVLYKQPTCISQMWGKYTSNRKMVL